MDLRNCPDCGKLFAYVAINMCPNCKKEEDKEFERVKEYLYKHSKISIYELAEATEVDEGKIMRWVREGRIEGKSYTGLAIPCERCGKQITEGRYCLVCANELARGFSQTPKGQEEPLDKSKAKFHTKF